MEAGRELDALIAEKIMGQDYSLNSLEGSLVLKDPPHYSTNIAAAWEVVEKLGPDWDLISMEQGWIASVGSSERARAETAPLAICLAALKAMRG